MGKHLAERLQADYIDREIIAQVAARLNRQEREVIAKEMPPTDVLGRIAEALEHSFVFGDAMAGDNALFTRWDAVEAAWAAVDQVLETHSRVRPYRRGSWGPKEADALIAADGGWHTPTSRSPSSRSSRPKR